MLNRAILYFHTLRYIGGVRLCSHVLFRLKGFLNRFAESPARFVASGPDTSPSVMPFLPYPMEFSSGDLKRGSWTFLAENRLAGFPPDWDQKASALWEYNLHYFQYLSCLDFQSAKAVIGDWAEKYKKNQFRKGWTPYPLSLRLRNWVKFFYYPYRHRIAADPAFQGKFMESLASQCAELWRKREFHFGGNHYLENLITFQFLRHAFPFGCFEDWGTRTEEVFLKELDEQILVDGGYFERSPLYHSIILLHLLDLWNVLPSEGKLRGILKTKLDGMLSFLHGMSHPDGEIVLFNDAAFGIAPAPAAIHGYAASMGLHASPGEDCAFVNSGYFSYRNSSGDFLAVDMAPIGPDYVPAHAHSDFGTFELSMDGHRLVTDTGVSTYIAGIIRDGERSTSAHNTIQIGGAEQAECWKAFRVARRYHPHDVRYGKLPDGFWLSGWHDGYHRLPGKPLHSRHFRWIDDGVLLIGDRITNRWGREAVSRIHFAPGAEVRTEGRSFKADFNGRTYSGIFSGSGSLTLDTSTYSPRFGVRLERKCLEYRFAPDEHSVMFALAKGAVGLSAGEGGCVTHSSLGKLELLGAYVSV